MHNFQRASVDMKGPLGTNMGLIEKSCDAGFYTRWISAMDFNDAGAAASPTVVIGTSGALPPSWNLQNAVSTRVSSYVHRFSGWESGVFELVVHYGITVTGGNVSWTCNIRPIVENEAMSSSAIVVLEAAPSATGVISKLSFRSAEINAICPINREHIGVLVEVGRRGGNASDTATGDIRIYGAELIYHETKRRTGGAL